MKLRGPATEGGPGRKARTLARNEKGVVCEAAFVQAAGDYRSDAPDGRVQVNVSHQQVNDRLALEKL